MVTQSKLLCGFALMAPVCIQRAFNELYFQLFNLRRDEAESRDLSGEHPDRLEEMRREMTVIFKEVQAEAPQWPAWKWPKYESSRIQWPDYWLDRKRRPAK